MTLLRSLLFALIASSLAACAADPGDTGSPSTGPDLGDPGALAGEAPGLVARAVLPAATFGSFPRRKLARRSSASSELPSESISLPPRWTVQK